MKHLLKIRVFLKPYRGQIVASLAILLGMTALNLFVPRVIQSVVDNGIARGEIGSIVRASLILLSLGLGSAILAFIQRYLTEWIAARVALGADLTESR